MPDSTSHAQARGSGRVRLIGRLSISVITRSSLRNTQHASQKARTNAAARLSFFRGPSKAHRFQRTRRQPDSRATGRKRERQRQREAPTLTRTWSGKRTPEGFKETKPRQGRTVRRAGGHLFLDVVGAAVPFGWGVLSLEAQTIWERPSIC